MCEELFLASFWEDIIMILIVPIQQLLHLLILSFKRWDTYNKVQNNLFHVIMQIKIIRKIEDMYVNISQL